MTTGSFPPTSSRIRHHVGLSGHLNGPLPDVIHQVESLQVSSQNRDQGTPKSSIAVGNEASPVSPIRLSPRAYQLEMLDYSLRQNAIVVMDTGSGKTQVAVLRIKAELDRSGSDKLIWFLAPTVALCWQQYDVIRLQIPSVTIKLMTGNDDVDAWSEHVWEAMLSSARIVVSTHQVLLDALCHAFVSISQLSLIVFDEAHHCVGKHPAAKMMTDFYHRSKSSGLDTPSILGITATPSITEDLRNIEILEAVLDSQCVTPTVHRDELIKCASRPQIRSIPYMSSQQVLPTESMQRLQEQFLQLDIAQDPYVLRLQDDPTDRNRRALEKAIEKYDTFAQNQIKCLRGRCDEILLQLGSWAADLYLWKATSAFLERSQSGQDLYLTGWADTEKQYLADFLRRVSPPCPSSAPQSGSELSDKAHVLLASILSFEEPITCIIFAKERATVSALRDLLASCPAIMDNHRVGAVVGSSFHQSRRTLFYEPLGGMDQTALQKFRSGQIDILVATSVLEEGIDVPACNVVICFDHPDTPKAFIQRRGRARMKESQLVLLSEHASSAADKWATLEEDMRSIYQDTQREILRLQHLEESDETYPVFFEVASTGARIDFDNAKSHLQHFCLALFTGEFIDNHPDYVIQRHVDLEPPMLSATVFLPPALPFELRQIESERSWLSEKNATKDAAFQAYKALYAAGLVNEHLLPLKIDDIQGPESRDAKANIQSLWDPWAGISKIWKNETEELWRHALVLEDDIFGKTYFSVVLPCGLDQFSRPLRLFLDMGEICHVRCLSRRPISAAEARALPDHTSTLLALHFAHRWPVQDKSHVIKVVADGIDMSIRDIGAKAFDPSEPQCTEGRYLIRDQMNGPCHYLGMLPSKPAANEVQRTIYEYEEAPEHVPYLIVKRWTRRADFLHPLMSRPSSTPSKPYPQVVPLPWATVDKVPLKYTKLGMLIPSLLHEIEISLVAAELSRTVLRKVNLANLDLIREAICSPSAAEPSNYERLEFLGDSVLKYCAAIQVLAIHPEWPEGYLSLFKDRLVSNSRLSRAAVESGLGQFILIKPFTGQKWRPKYLEDYDAGDGDGTGFGDAASARELSTKTLADVVEALIGAAFIDGGVDKARACISTFINDIEWRDVTSNREVLFSMAPEGEQLSPELEPLEELAGYTFRKKSLLIEAMTHPSCLFGQGRRTYEHLELLGDAILDYIVVGRMYSATPPLPNARMHLLKTAMVNGDFLAFLAMDHQLRRTEVAVTADSQRVFDREAAPLALWKFMRHSSEPIVVEQAATVKRYEALRSGIVASLRQGAHYPWALFARVQPKKFMSDILESLLGAVWVDSGSVGECESVLGRFGLLGYLDRLMEDQVQVQHPKELLGILAAAEKVRYHVGMEEAADGDKRYTCRVTVGQRVVADVSDGVNKDEVKTKAAEEAVRHMGGEDKPAWSA